MANCYCKSNREYNDCCGKFHSNKAKPETAEELMRSRYAAFASKNIDYILATEKLKKTNSKTDLRNWVNVTT